MEEQKPQREKPKNQKIKLMVWFLAIIIIITILVIIFLTTKEDEQSLEVPTELLKVKYQSLERFTHVSVEEIKELTYFHTYHPSNDDNIIITVIMSNREIDSHQETYTLKRGEIEIDDTSVIIGYQKSGQNYQSMAFDFKLEKES